MVRTEKSVNQQFLNNWGSTVLFATCACVLSACTTTGTSTDAPLQGADPAVAERFYPASDVGAERSRQDDLPLAERAVANPTRAEPVSTPSRLLYYDNDRGALRRLKSGAESFEVSSLQLNFVDIPADQVAQAVISEALGETVAIAEGVSGTVTLTSPEPVSTEAALEALETVLAASDLALVKKPSGYLMTSLATAREGSRSVRRGTQQIGYVTELVTIQHTSPSAIVRLVDPFISNSLTLTPDDSQGLISLSGPKGEIEGALEAIRLFDAPSLTDKVYGLFELQFTEVAAIRQELEALMQASNPQSSDLIQLIELPRLNQLFVITRSQQQFREVESWIARLDIASGGDERRLRYYVARNTDADILSQQLSAAFGNGSGFSGGFSDGFSGTPAGLQNDGIRDRGTAPVRAPAPVRSGGDGLSIVPDLLNNALIIRATDAEYREILTLVERMDVLPPQVLIEATIAEVTLTDDLSFGVRWFFERGKFRVDFSDNDSGAVGPVFPGLSTTFFDGTTAGAALNTLSSVTDVTVLSAPSIMVQNNQVANLQVGDEVPIVTQEGQRLGDAGNGSDTIIRSVQLRETGVILEVQPRINANDMVVLDVTQEVSEVAQTITSGIDSPTIRQRQFTSTVAVRNNGTVALGGLIRETQTDNQSGIPGLKDLPLLGNAFKSTNQNVRRTELIIFLTPRIIRNDSDSENALAYLKQTLKGLEGRIELVE